MPDHPRLSDKTRQPHFSVERLASLSDGVFAVAMTLLAYNVHVPHDLSDAGLSQTNFLRELQTLCLSFAVAAMFWRGHIKLLELMRAVKCPPISAALLFLLFVVLLPLSTGGHASLQSAEMVLPFYEANLAVLAFTKLGLWLLVLAHFQLETRTRLRYLMPSISVSAISF